MTIAELLVYHREQRGYSQSELADILLVTRQAVSKWENGNNFPDIENLMALSDLYDISIDELVRGSEFFSKPYIVSEKLKSLWIIVPCIGFLMIIPILGLLSAANKTFSLFTLFIVLIILGIATLFFAVNIELDGWKIQRNGITLSYFKTLKPYQVVKMMQAFLVPKIRKEHAPLLLYSDMRAIEISYKSRVRISYHDIMPDIFCLKAIMNNDDVYLLNITPELQNKLPHACSFFEKKGVDVIDKQQIIYAIAHNMRLYDYVHQNKNS